MAELAGPRIEGGLREGGRSNGAEIISAITGEGLEHLRTSIDQHLVAAMEQVAYRLDVQDGAKLAWLYAHGEVVERHDDEAAIMLTVRLLPADRARFDGRPA